MPIINGRKVKEDEALLWATLSERTTKNSFPHVRALARELGIHEKRACYIVEKWTDQGLYDWGVNPLAGWLVDP